MFNATKSMKLVARVQEKILFMFEIKVWYDFLAIEALTSCFSRSIFEINA
jgi:hypothetical protein